MNVQQFVSSRRADWRALEDFLQQCAKLSLPRVPLERFRAGSLLYRQAVADLAYARMRFPGSALVPELERLLARAHSVVYQARRRPSNGAWRFWLQTWPAQVRGAAGPILLAAGVFWAAAVAGLVTAAWQPALEAYFVSPQMREAMNSGHLWTESVTAVAPGASTMIARNNISVALLAWGLGMSFGVGTMGLLVTNGLMLGAISEACLRAGLFGPLAEFVVGHGALELPAIWIASGAGLIMGEAMLFPGQYSRSIEIKRAAQRSVQIAVGTIPMLLIAAFIEGFVSPSRASGMAKSLLGAGLALAYFMSILAAPNPPAGDDESISE